MGKKAPKPKDHPRFDFRWKNFRSFVDTGPIEIRPISILIGPNNSGKTSVVTPLLLMKQTVEAKDPAIHLKTTGPMVNLGSFKDITFRHKTTDPISFFLRFAYPGRTEEKKIKSLGLFSIGRVSL